MVTLIMSDASDFLILFLSAPNNLIYFDLLFCETVIISLIAFADLAWPIALQLNKLRWSNKKTNLHH